MLAHRQLAAAVNPGTVAGTGTGICIPSIAFQAGSNFNVLLNGTMWKPDMTSSTYRHRGLGWEPERLAGLRSGREQLLRDSKNDLADPIVGTFNGLGEGGLFAIGSDFFRISYIGGTGNDVTSTKVAVGIWTGAGCRRR